MKDIENMSLDELKNLKNEWYKTACNDGSISKCGAVCRELGKIVPAKYGPKYKWYGKDVSIYVDDWGKYMIVKFNGKEVLSTHPCDKLFVPGEWMDVINKYFDLAEYKRKEAEDRKNTEEEFKLRKELSL